MLVNMQVLSELTIGYQNRSNGRTSVIETKVIHNDGTLGKVYSTVVQDEKGNIRLVLESSTQPRVDLYA